MELDETDKRILELLSHNSRMSYSDLAKHFGFSDVAVRKRVDKLVENKVIQKFTTVLDYEKLGKNVSAFIFFKTRSDKTQQVAEQLLEIDCIYDVYISLGVYDIIAKSYCSDVTELKTLTEVKLTEINGIIEVKPSIVFDEVKSE